jgi:imidazolonepropionase-like amidohydrolase
MNVYLTRAFLFFIILASAQARPLALVGGRLIDGFGGHPLANSVIIIENDRITTVGTVGDLKVPADAEVISTEGMDVLPGLWDCHVHTMLLGHSDYDLSIKRIRHATARSWRRRPTNYSWRGLPALAISVVH